MKAGDADQAETQMRTVAKKVDIRRPPKKDHSS